MASFRNMVDMTRTPAEKLETVLPPVLADVSDVPPGLYISLTEIELEKLDIDTDDCDVGDMIHLSAMAKLTSKSINDTEAGCKMRFELALVWVSVEDENTEQTDRE